MFVAPGPEVTRTTPGFPVAIGHVGATLLMTNLDQANLRIVQRVEDGHRRTALQAEDVLHALALEALYDLLAASGYSLSSCHVDPPVLAM